MVIRQRHGSMVELAEVEPQGRPHRGGLPIVDTRILDLDIIFRVRLLMRIENGPHA
jgi:hypothetical protein